MYLCTSSVPCDKSAWLLQKCLVVTKVPGFVTKVPDFVTKVPGFVTKVPGLLPKCPN